MDQKRKEPSAGMSESRSEPSAEFYCQMAELTDEVYKFVKVYNDYATTPRDYGTGKKMNMLSVHIMTSIEEHPGITVTELAERWVRTKGSISQVLKTLDAEGYITRKKEGKNIRLFPTASGIELSMVHKYYDAIKFKERLAYFLKTCTEAEISAFYKVLNCYTELMMNSEHSETAQTEP